MVYALAQPCNRDDGQEKRITADIVRITPNCPAGWKIKPRAFYEQDYPREKVHARTEQPLDPDKQGAAWRIDRYTILALFRHSNRAITQ